MEEMPIYEELVFLDIDKDDNVEVLEFLSNELVDKGYVKPSFLEGVLEREKVYPTGIDTGDIKVAIPHTDSEHVLESCIAVGVLEKPVVFKDIVDPNGMVDVDIVFILAIAEAENQVQVLTKLMSIFSEKELLNNIYNSDKEGIYKILKNWFSKE